MKPNKTLNINIFTYKNDEDLLIYNVKCIDSQNLPNLSIHVIDDENNPISEKRKNELLLINKNIFYRQSKFERNGNLNGKSAVIGILEELISSSDNEEGYSIKLDTDTLILNPNFLKNIYEHNLALFATLRPGNIPSGILYCLRNNILPKLLNVCNTIELPKHCAEDVTILSLATALTQDENIWIIDGQHEKNVNGTISGWDYDKPERILYDNRFFEHYEVITMGNWKFYENLTLDYVLSVTHKIYERLINYKESKGNREELKSILEKY